MQERKQEQQKNENHAHEHAGREHGMQGIDKAPGEEPSADNVQFPQEAFKEKKVDADPAVEKDKPEGNQDV